MITAMKIAFINVAKKVLLAALTEKALEGVVIAGLEKLAKSTENTIDDRLVEDIKKALKWGLYFLVCFNSPSPLVTL